MQNVIKATWLLMCISVAVWGIQAAGAADLVASYFIGILTMPLGLISIAMCSSFLSWLTKLNPNLGVTHEILIGFIVHGLAIFAGYIQWFVLIPKIFLRLKRASSMNKYGLPLIGVMVVIYGTYIFYNHVFPKPS